MEADDVPSTLLAKQLQTTSTSIHNSPGKGKNKNNGNQNQGQNKNNENQNKGKNKNKDHPSKLKAKKPNASNHQCHRKETSKNENKNNAETNIQVVQVKVQEGNLNQKPSQTAEQIKKEMQKVKKYWKRYQAKAKVQEQQEPKKNNIKKISFSSVHSTQQAKQEEHREQITSSRHRKLSGQQRNFQEQFEKVNFDQSDQEPPQSQEPLQPQIKRRQNQSNINYYLQNFRSQVSNQDYLAQFQNVQIQPLFDDIIFDGRIVTKNRSKAIQVNYQNLETLVLEQRDDQKNNQKFKIKVYGNNQIWIQTLDNQTLQVSYNFNSGVLPRITFERRQENEASKLQLRKHQIQDPNMDRTQGLKLICYQNYFLGYDQDRRVRFFQIVHPDHSGQEQSINPIFWRIIKVV